MAAKKDPALKSRPNQISIELDGERFTWPFNETCTVTILIGESHPVDDGRPALRPRQYCVEELKALQYKRCHVVCEDYKGALRVFNDRLWCIHQSRLYGATVEFLTVEGEILVKRIRWIVSLEDPPQDGDDPPQGGAPVADGPARSSRPVGSESVQPFSREERSIP